jgi:threonine/homoserine/homoserine lactone efflux protein
MTIPIDTWLAFVLASLAIELTPGPNMGYLAVLSASRGRRAGYAATAGVGLGLAIIGIASALGLAAVISSSRFVYEGLRWAGVAYLLWLAWEGWNDHAELSPDTTDHDDEAAFFRRGLITNLLNPKAAIFFVAVLPTFVDAAKPVLSQTLVLSMTYVVVATIVHAGIATLAGAVRHLLTAKPRLRDVLRRGLALSLGAIAIWFAVSTAR